MEYITDNHTRTKHVFTGDESRQWMPYFRLSEIGKEYDVLYRNSDNFLVMSNTEVEIISNQQALKEARGDVLMIGLGINLINDLVASLDNVNSVTTIEKYQDVIENTPHKHRVVCRDATSDLSDLGKFDYIWTDASEHLGVSFDKLLKTGGTVRQWNANYGTQ